MSSAATLFTHIVVHVQFHHDEVVAILLLVLYGEKEFPGISQAKVMLIDDPSKYRAEDLMAEGKLAVGCCGGMFDDHGREDEDTCAAKLVAEHLGLMGDLAIRQLVDMAVLYDRYTIRLEYVNDQVEHPERYGPRISEDTFPNVVKMLHRTNSDNPQLVLDLSLAILRSKLKDSQGFQATVEQLRGVSPRYLDIPGYRLSLLWLGPDSPLAQNRYVAKVMRWLNFNLMVRRNQKGNVAIVTSGRPEKAAINLLAVFVAIRKAELAKRGIVHDLTDEQLGKPKLEIDKWWYFLPGSMTLLNGSDQSSTGVEPTMLTDDEIWEILVSKMTVDPPTAEPPRRLPVKGVETVKAPVAIRPEPVRTAEQVGPPVSGN